MWHVLWNEVKMIMRFPAKVTSQQCFICVAWGWGDPHITTLDNVRYTFNGLGEYRMLELEDDSFKIQGRTGRVGGDGNATEFVALAFSLTEDNETIEIQV